MGNHETPEQARGFNRLKIERFNRLEVEGFRRLEIERSFEISVGDVVFDFPAAERERFGIAPDRKKGFANSARITLNGSIPKNVARGSG